MIEEAKKNLPNHGKKACWKQEEGTGYICSGCGYESKSNGPYCTCGAEMVNSPQYMSDAAVEAYKRDRNQSSGLNELAG